MYAATLMCWMSTMRHKVSLKGSQAITDHKTDEETHVFLMDLRCVCGRIDRLGAL